MVRAAPAYRAALRLRRVSPGLAHGDLRWQEAPAGVLCSRRGHGFTCLVNVSASPVPLPAGGRVLLSSAPLRSDGFVGADTAAWVET